MVALVGLALVGAAVAPRLSARLAGDEYRFRVAPVDPIDAFRGAYVDLDYPDLHLRDGEVADQTEGEGTLYVALVRDGDVWRAAGYSRTRPDDAPYLTCNDRDWRIRCGIESWFLPQDEARALEDAVRAGSAVATLRVDGRGNAALIAVDPR